jgi:hypothetical protein
MRRMRLTQVRFGLDRLDPHRLHQPRRAFVIDGIALAASPRRHPTYPIIRRLGVLLIQ